MNVHAFVFFSLLGSAYSWWELVFKVVTGGPFGAYDLFMSNNTRNTNNMAAQQLTNQVLDHYKSDVINDWQNNDISKIRVSYYYNGAELKYFVFNASGSTRTDWFSRYRLLETNYIISDFAVPTGRWGEYFNIEGDTVSASSINRHFYINEGYYGCSGDLGWTLVVDGPGPCPMEAATTTAVYVVNTPTYSLMPGLTADFMAILVEREICNKVMDSSTNNEFLSINETAEIQRRINHIKANLTVPVNSTSQYIRGKTCAEDDRFSSRAIGTSLGAGILSFLAALILFPDVKEVIIFSFRLMAAACKRNNGVQTDT